MEERKESVGSRSQRVMTELHFDVKITEKARQTGADIIEITSNGRERGEEKKRDETSMKGRKSSVFIVESRSKRLVER